MTIVLGSAKIYVTDPALIPSTLQQLGLAAKTEVDTTSLIATTAQLIQESTARMTRMPCKSLRDAEYAIRKQMNQKAIKMVLMVMMKIVMVMVLVVVLIILLPMRN